MHVAISREEKVAKNTATTSATSGGYLARPANIYAEPKKEIIPPVEKPLPAIKEDEELVNLQMQLIEKEDTPEIDWPMPEETQPEGMANDVSTDEMEEQQRKATERLQKLRNLSFNVNAADHNNEFETIPAYIRRNMEMHSNSAPENFYSNYEVKTDENNKSHISTINTFLDGKKPD
jgi:cell division protein FtsZ